MGDIESTDHRVTMTLSTCWCETLPSSSDGQSEKKVISLLCFLASRFVVVGELDASYN